MTANQNDLYTTWGDGFANVLDGICHASGQDAYEVVVSAFRRALSLQEFHTLGEKEFARLSEAANKVLETNRVEPRHMRHAAEYVRRNWPLETQ